MRANTISLKEVAAVVAAILVNAFILSQVVGGISANQNANVAFAQPYMNGESCMDPGICASGHCEQGVCCDTACNGTSRLCNQPGSLGVCTPVIPAPSLSWPGQFLAATLLTLIGWFGLRRMRRSN